MTVKDLYRIWSPGGQKWVDWVRPVPFVELKEYSNAYSYQDDSVPVIEYVDKRCEETAVLVDLPGIESVKEGVALAQKGFRPIPIFNGTARQKGARATVDNESASIALALFAKQLSRITIPKDANPAFLTDKNRLQRYKMDVSVFDNSWDVYPQDLPSADYLWENGIKKVLVVSPSLAKDLKKILYSYQKKNIEIYLTDRYGTPKKIKIFKPLLKEKD